MFIVILNYIKPLEELDKYMEPHLKFLDKYYSMKKIVFSGKKSPRTGGVIVSNAETREEIEEIIKEDPFYIHSLAEYEVVEMIPTKWDERFSCFIKI